jgi:short-subunit dehydrogenase
MEMTRLFKVGTMAPSEVARLGVEGYEAGRAVVVPGATNRLGAIGAQLLPRALTRRLAGKLQG